MERLNVVEELTKWCIFTIAIAALPLLFKLVWQITWNQKITFSKFFSTGELLLISAVISGGAVGKLFGCGKSLVFPTLIAGGACILISCASAFWFAVLWAGNDQKANPNRKINEKAVAIGSVILFTVTILVSLLCVIVEYKI
jgi:hypothetical protein